MRNLIYILLLAIPLFTGCHKKIWDKLNDHEARIARLEALCNQFNTNITSLQTIVAAINARDYVKDVVPVMENGVVIGYAITFGNSSPVTIYNGKNGKDGEDGKDGKDGKDGHTPIIGIKSEDGAWYWTLDGEWIVDESGSRVRADGAAGITPQLKIDEDFWWVSYDNGASWIKLGSAVGEGAGDSMFQEVRQDDNYVYLVLANGEVIQIAKNRGLTWVYV